MLNSICLIRRAVVAPLSLVSVFGCIPGDAPPTLRSTIALAAPARLKSPGEPDQQDGAKTSSAPIRIPAGALNVRAMGARGDGIANDRPAIQAAVDKARPGASLYFPAGTYLIDDAIKVRESRLTFIGDGDRSVIRHGGVTGLQLGTGGEPLTGLVVEQLKFIGLPGRYKKDGRGGISIQIFGPHGTVVRDCEFVGPDTAVFDAGKTGTTFGTRVDRCRVNGWGSVAIFCNGGEQVTNCRLIQDDPDRLGERSSHGFYIHSGCSDVLIADTLIQNARKYAAQIYGQDVGITTARITFRNVVVKDCENGITVQQSLPSAARAQNVVVQGCSFLNTYNGPALSIKQGDGVQVLNNVFDTGSVGLQLGVWAPYEPGFSINNLQASGNSFRNFQIGIYGLASNGGTFTNVSVTANTETNCQKGVDLTGAPTIAYSP